MSLNSYVAQKRLAIFEELQQGLSPSEGSFDVQALKDARVKGAPQIGTTRYEPHAIFLEFIYQDPRSSSVVVTVELAPPERIVFMPVPEWVIESIWQGEIDGSFLFESEADALLKSFRSEMEPHANLKWFGPRQAKRRE